MHMRPMPAAAWASCRAVWPCNPPCTAQPLRAAAASTPPAAPLPLMPECWCAWCLARSRRAWATEEQRSRRSSSNSSSSTTTTPTQMRSAPGTARPKGLVPSALWCTAPRQRCHWWRSRRPTRGCCTAACLWTEARRPAMLPSQQRRCRKATALITLAQRGQWQRAPRQAAAYPGRFQHCEAQACAQARQSRQPSACWFPTAAAGAQRCVSGGGVTACLSARRLARKTI